MLIERCLIEGDIAYGQGTALPHYRKKLFRVSLDFSLRLLPDRNPEIKQILKYVKIAAMI